MFRFYGSLIEQHDLRLVVLAALICLLASYTAFSMMKRLYGTRSRYPWVIAAAVVTGCGSWATQAIALLAFQPGVTVGYNVGLTVLSGLIAVAGAGVGFWVARSTERMALGGAIVGFAIGAMHYAGMAGVLIQAHEVWNIAYIEASLVLSASFGAAALSRAQLTPDLKGRIISAILLTMGVCGMHFVGMAGLTLIPDPSIVIPQDTLAIVWFAIALTAVVLLIVGLGIVASLVDQHIAEIEVAKRELEEALVLADAANTSKSKFISTMSHELRSPLNVIIGFSELLKKGTFGPREEQYRDYITNILNSGTHLLRLVNDILDISKFDAGQLELKEEIVALNEIVETSIALASPDAEKAGVRVCISVQSDLPKVRADSNRLRQVLINLLSNAIRFTPQGGGVNVSTFWQGGNIVLSVADTGIGMARSDIPKALERFGQIDTDLSRKYDGAGLGLPLAKHLVELHGGTLRIESEPGVGTIVTVVLPARRIVVERQRMSQAASA